MGPYLLRRLLLIPPTLLGILLLNFVIIQAAPGGPVEQIMAQMGGLDSMGSTRLDTSGGGERVSGADEGGSAYRGSRGVDARFIAELEQQFGFDKPAHERFFLMVGNYLRFDLGESFFRGRSVTELILEKMPVSISLGLWSTLLIYLISIPLGIHKAIRHGSRFDVWTSSVVIIGSVMPSPVFCLPSC